MKARTPDQLGEELASHYCGRRALVTGGLGFIGSNLARRLVDLGAEVLAADALLPDLGGNSFNLDGYEGRLRIEVVDLRDDGIAALLRGQDLVFNLAGQVSHMESMRDPFRDLDLNCRAQLALLEACRRENPRVKVVFSSTRHVYGAPTYLPLDEGHPLQPADVNGINKLVGETYHLLYHRAYGIRACALRLTNTYGPRMLIRHPRQTAVGWFIRQIVDGEEIQIWGDGRQLRDYIYVDDVVEALLLAGASEAVDGLAINLGGLAPICHLDLIKLLVSLAGTGHYSLVPFPEAQRVIDVGDAYSSHQLASDRLGWQPRIELEDGLRRTMEYYRRHREAYR